MRFWKLMDSEAGRAAVWMLLALIVPTIASATLIDRENGRIYDVDQNITWLADANLAASNAFGVAGINANVTMPWDVANAWIAAMNQEGYLGFSDWRLPVTQDPNASCTNFEPPRDCRRLWAALPRI